MARTEFKIETFRNGRWTSNKNDVCNNASCAEIMVASRAEKYGFENVRMTEKAA